MKISKDELESIIIEELCAELAEGKVDEISLNPFKGITTPIKTLQRSYNKGRIDSRNWREKLGKWLDAPAPGRYGAGLRDAPATTATTPTAAPTATDTTKKSNIKYTLPNNFRANLEGRMQEVYSELARAHEKQYPGKDFRKDLIELVKLLGPHNPMMDVRKLDESNRLGRVLKMVAKINGGGDRDSENAFKSLGALKNADKNGGVSRVIHAMLMYRGRKGGEHQIGNDLSQFVGALMNTAQAVDISGRKSIQ